MVVFQNSNEVWKERDEGFKDAFELLESVGAKYVLITESLVNERNMQMNKVKRVIIKHFPAKVTETSNPKFNDNTRF